MRTLCPHCRESYDALPELVERMQLGDLAKKKTVKLWRAAGCAHCNGTGYLGRSSIVEVLPMSDAIRQLVLQHAKSSLIRKASIDEGMQTMHLHGMKKALAGTTTVEEVLRVTRMG